MTKVVCFGEVLWDIFPNGEKQIGGAPLNVALRFNAFENEVTMISAIGNDDNGNKLFEYLKENGLDTSYIQIKNDFATGEVQITLDKKGVAQYEIKHPRAWDKIERNDNIIDKVKTSQAFVFGSLIARDQVSRETLLKLLDLATYKVFDINLRPPHYSFTMLELLMEKADFIKLNDEELYEISNHFNSKYNGLEQNLKFIAQKTKTKHICVTKGEHGAVLLFNDKLYYNSGYQIKVADTVGAGDSFLGSLISKLLSGEDPQKAIDFACAVGAMVAQSKGANPKFNQEEIQEFANLY
ncbi:carbohydrate kinase family protein [Seonamhaeicola aphaedonensis]|uniref:Fructokinase n=1 Tax=Seonamhaeicola aphaedonensis TaxID=1461338 RepID=A0A3D9HA34_9FLAO|nr:carbohydrate kinase [Seonamhaeicola aphaedonensis]RED46041.1 fructokinase [Seonamhaeicola aphaedonensis]